MRNKDNFTNSKQYILEQIYPYSNSDNQSEDFNILKMKIWVIDGPIRQEEFINNETPDKDVTDPMNHWSNLQNDLTYLDKYIRTKDGTLIMDPPELNYSQFKQQRLDNKIRFISKIKDEETGETYSDWEQPYNQRPTLLSDDDFQELYEVFKIKESLGEWSTAFDITKSITEYVIDVESYQAEAAVINNQTPGDIYEILDSNAASNVLKNDYNYVVEMNKIYDEVLPMVLSVKPELPEEDLTDPLGGPDLPPTWSNSQLLIANLPERRIQVYLEANHSSHKGTIIESLGTGGYRFKYRDENGDELSLPIDPILLPADVNSTISPDLFGELEDNFNNWVWGYYYEEEDPVTFDVTSNVVSLSADRYSLPSGTINPSAGTLERFEVLNIRWIVLNNLREYQIQNNGTRNIIESMLNAEIPDMLPDKVSHFNDKKDQKEYYIDILKERLEEFN